MPSECGFSTCGRFALCGLSMSMGVCEVGSLSTRTAGLCRIPDDVDGVGGLGSANLE